MTKKEQELKQAVKEIIKKYGFVMISKSWFMGEDKTSVLFNAYDECGNCSRFYIDYTVKFADRQAMSTICLHEPREITNWFFK